MKFPKVQKPVKVEPVVEINTRRESRNIGGRTRGGKLTPTLATAFLGGEGGMINQSVTAELDTVAGRLITPVTMELTAVFVPVQAIDYLKDPTADYAGLTEVVRKKLLSGNPLFGLENETEISKRLGVKARSISGTKKVNEISRLAYVAAVNFLRQKKYAYATQLLHSSTAMAPALISENILQRMNGALDPDDRINGSVQLELGSMRLPVEGIGLTGNVSGISNYTSRQSDGIDRFAPTGNTTLFGVHYNVTGSGTQIRPDVHALFEGASAGGVSLTDFYNAEKQDKITRMMRDMIDANPIDGEEQVLRWAHGFALEKARHPFVIHQSSTYFQQGFQQASDGTSLLADISTSKMTVKLGFNAIVPVTELGGVVITLISVKPDETIADQPHPILSEPWSAINQIADQFRLDPVPVTMRELDGNVDLANENTVAFYTGHNQLKQMYVNYGFNDFMDIEDVENRTAIWQIAIPASVTPDNINYPETLSHYPFQDQNAEVCIYTVSSQAVVQTPIYFGPTPVEDVQIMTDEDITGLEND